MAQNRPGRPLKAILGGKNPQQAAEEFVRGTKIKDLAERRRLAADHAAVQKLGPELLGLFLDALDQPRAVDALGKSGEVLDQRG